MRMHYYKDPLGNFGDDLNTWLWPRLQPDLLHDDADELFVGIGTLLNHRLPAAPIKHIFGSGVGYGDTPVVDNTWIVHAVRGPLSAKALGLPPEKAITDAAVLIRRIAPILPAKRHRCGLIVTGHSIAQYDWASICEQAGIRFISCHWDVDTVLQAMGECEVLLCEAMHGAIVADALRIPWVPVSLYGKLLDFKWKDWLGSLQLEYRPEYLTPIYAPEQGSLRSRLKNETKRLLSQLGYAPASWSPARPRATGQRELDDVLTRLQALSRSTGVLSDDRLVDRHVERFSALLEQVHATGGSRTHPKAVAACRKAAFASWT